MPPPDLILALAMLGQWTYQDAERRIAPAAAEIHGPPIEAFAARPAEVRAAFTARREPAPEPEPQPEPQPQPQPQPVWEWRRANGDPSLELWGYLAIDGTFRFTHYRRVPGPARAPIMYLLPGG